MPSLALMTTSLLMQPRVQLASQATSTHCRLQLKFSSPRTSESFPAGQLSRSSSLIPGIVPTEVQNLAPDLVEPHGISLGPLFKRVQVPLDGTPSFYHVNRITQPGDISRVAEGVLYLIIHATARR